jgi:pyruvate kinase
LSERKGVNVPDVVLPLSALTDKDRRDLEFALGLGVEWLALSFVQRPEDLDEARTLVRDRAGILTKLEKPSAVDALDAIVESPTRSWWREATWVWSFRPKRCLASSAAQSEHAARRKPVIVATQMLESMIGSPCQRAPKHPTSHRDLSWCGCGDAVRRVGERQVSCSKRCRS